MLHKGDQIVIIDSQNEFCGAQGTIKFVLPAVKRAQAYIVEVADSTGLPLNLVLYRDDMVLSASNTSSHHPARLPLRHLTPA